MAKRTILIVDDSQIVLDITRGLFGPTGHTVVTISESFGSIGQILNLKPDVIIMDLEMPQMSGDVLIPIIKNVLGKKTPPIILHSDAPEIELKRIATSLQVDAYIRKGHSANLLTTTCKLLSKEELHGQATG